MWGAGPSTRAAPEAGLARHLRIRSDEVLGQWPPPQRCHLRRRALRRQVEKRPFHCEASPRSKLHGVGTTGIVASFSQGNPCKEMHDGRETDIPRPRPGSCSRRRRPGSRGQLRSEEGSRIKGHGQESREICRKLPEEGRGRNRPSVISSG